MSISASKSPSTANNTEVVFTPAARRAMTARGSIHGYAGKIAGGFPDRVTPDLAGFLAEHALSVVDVMKVDIEGFEYEAVLGSPEVFRAHRVRCLLIEIHGSLLAARGRRAEAISELLLSHGYERRALAGYEIFTAPA